MRLWGEVLSGGDRKLFTTHHKGQSHEPEHLCLENVRLLTQLVVFQGLEMSFLNFKQRLCFPDVTQGFDSFAFDF